MPNYYSIDTVRDGYRFICESSCSNNVASGDKFAWDNTIKHLNGRGTRICLTCLVAKTNKYYQTLSKAQPATPEEPSNEQ